MSRVGKNPVIVPEGVTVEVAGKSVSAKGKLGQLSMTLTNDIDIKLDGNELSFKPISNSIFARKMWGTARSRAQNLVTGVSEGFTKELEIQGVGYRAAVKGKNLELQLGFSHDVIHPIPEGITIKCESQTAIAISGADKQAVGQIAAEIRAYRPPEPYKGKGVRYKGEQVLRKEGKKK
ncbi:MAG: 50S ribosomal protein L6 [Alphaproteobacteria bacterium]|nr:50S ribosomal protein L6 [Rhodospirillales bacterium]MCW9045936.1 50S ribosomal protein L6 [Alphaproteobacteria bacterium]